jgi:hypothetical protein
MLCSQNRAAVAKVDEPTPAIMSCADSTCSVSWNEFNSCAAAHDGFMQLFDYANSDGLELSQSDFTEATLPIALR